MAPCARLAGLCDLELLRSVIDTIKTSRRQYSNIFKRGSRRTIVRTTVHIAMARNHDRKPPSPSSSRLCGLCSLCVCPVPGFNLYLLDVQGARLRNLRCRDAGGCRQRRSRVGACVGRGFVSCAHEQQGAEAASKQAAVEILEETERPRWRARRTASPPARPWRAPRPRSYS